MNRTLTAIACLLLTGGVASSGEQSQAHDVTHEGDRDECIAVAKLRLQRALQEIIDRQERFREELNKHRNDHRPHIPPPPEPRLGDVAKVVVDRGKVVTVLHVIDWRAYPNDELEVKLAASDASLKVPEKLTLEFETHQFRFEYAVQAGEKTGEFTITLTPTAGKPVTVQVIVK